MATSASDNSSLAKASAAAISTKHESTIVAGGGAVLNETAAKSIPSFSTPVLSHLLSIYKTVPGSVLFQDANEPVADEAAFLSYMSSSGSSSLASPKTRDLSYPMSCYYISSSHNTYLSGNQLYGDASKEAYENVLKRGCRCLEIDVWDGDDAEISSSDENEEANESLKVHGSDKGGPKSSRWGRVKAKASHIRSRSHSASNQEGSIPVQQSPVHHHGQMDGSTLSHQLETTHLQPSNTQAYNSRSEPRVLHGYTMTQSVSFRSVCHAIKDSAFVATDLPIIVSLEIHASLSQQEIMVQIMREAWAGHLVNIKQVDESAISILPSPDSLRNKILIKVKWTPNTTTGESNNPVDHVGSNTKESASEGNIPTTPNKQKKASKVLADLSELGVYTRAYTFKHFTQPEASIPTHVFSLSEGKMHEMHSDPAHGPALFHHNKNFLMRVFPKGTRIRSTNVDPTFHWRQGAQMVALNWQKLDKGMMLNEGMFAGQEGWVLKPEGYRGARSNPQTLAHDQNKMSESLPKKRVLDLEITLFAAQNLPIPAGKETSHLAKMKPYIRMQLHVDTHGPPGQGKFNASSNDESEAYAEEEANDNKMKRQSRTSKSDSPDYGSERLSWLGIPDVEDELSFLRIQIKDDHSIGRDEVVAWACIRLDRLLPGYRFIHLLDTKGMPSSAVILVHISKLLT